MVDHLKLPFLLFEAYYLPGKIFANKTIKKSFLQTIYTAGQEGKFYQTIYLCAPDAPEDETFNPLWSIWQNDPVPHFVFALLRFSPYLQEPSQCYGMTCLACRSDQSENPECV